MDNTSGTAVDERAAVVRFLRELAAEGGRAIEQGPPAAQTALRLVEEGLIRAADLVAEGAHHAN